MPDPINYSIDVQTPFQTALQGYQAGAAIRNDQQQQTQQQLQLQQQQLLRQAQQATIANPTADNYARLMLLDPKSSEGINRAWSAQNAAQQQSQASDLLKWGAAIKSGQPQIAADAMSSRADAIERKAGAPTLESQMWRTYSQIAKDHPEFALGQIQALLSANPNGKDAAEALSKFGAEQRAQNEAPADLAQKQALAAKTSAEATTAAVTAENAPANATADLQQKAAQLGLTKAQVRDINSQVGTRAAQLNLDGQKLQLETDKFLFDKQQKLQDIGQDGRKLVNDAAVAAGSAKLSADRANDLAGRLEALNGWTGAGGNFAEWLKKATGSQDAVTELRTQYTALRNSEGVKNLPPGPASDNDVKMALDGIPPPTADPKVMQSWLKGVAKLNDINAAVENARVDYAAQNKGLLTRAKTSFSAGGTDVVAGDSWQQISRRVAETAARRYVKDADKVKPPTGGGPAAIPVAPAPGASGAGRVIDWSSLRDN